MREISRRDLVRLGLSVGAAGLWPLRTLDAATPNVFSIIFEGLCLYLEVPLAGLLVGLMKAPDHVPILSLDNDTFTGQKLALPVFPQPNPKITSFVLSGWNVVVNPLDLKRDQALPSMKCEPRTGCPDDPKEWEKLCWVPHFSRFFPKNKGVTSPKTWLDKTFGSIAIGRGTMKGMAPTDVLKGQWTFESYDPSQQGNSDGMTGNSGYPAPQAFTDRVRYDSQLSGNTCRLLFLSGSAFPQHLTLRDAGQGIAMAISYHMIRASTPRPPDRMLDYAGFYNVIQPALSLDVRPIPVLGSNTPCPKGPSGFRDREIVLFKELIDESIGCPGGTP